MSLVGRSDAAFGDKSAGGKCVLGYVIGLMSSSLPGPRHVLRLASKLTRRLVRSSLRGGVFALSGMGDRAALIRGFHEPFEGL